MIVPIKDEPSVGELIRGIHESLDGIEHEVVVVDKSVVPAIVEGALVVRQKSDGQGRAILEGVECASGDIIVSMNGDLSHDPSDLRPILAMMSDYDIVVGSRFAPGGTSHDTVFRKFVSHVFRLMAKSLLKLRLHDPLSGFWAMRREAFLALSLDPIGYKILVEILYKAMSKGFKITEVPITFGRRRAGKSKAGAREAARTLALILKLRLSS